MAGLSLSVERAADVAAGVSWPAVVVSVAAKALPILQLIAVVLAITASIFAIAVHRRSLGAKP